MTGWLDRLFPPFSARKREKPEEILYGIDERPPTSVLAAVGIQHVLLALMFAIYAVLAGQGIGLDDTEVAHYVGSTLLILGLGTILQAIRSRATPGLLFVFIPNPITLGAYIAVIVQYGVGAAMGGLIVSHLVIISLARFLPRMRPLFPPEVSGVVVLMLGVSLVTSGIGRSTGLIPAGELTAGAPTVAAATIACIVGFSVWGPRPLRTIAVLLAIIVGMAVAFATGVTDLAAFREIGTLPVFAIPFLAVPPPLPEFVPAAILILLLVEMFTAINQFACGLTMDKLNDAKWRRPDMPLVSRAVIASSATNLLHGLTGTLSSGFSSANIGLAHSTGVMSRHVGFVAGGLLCAIAFVPVIPGLIVFTPAPVIGAILVYTAAFLIVAGMDLILSRMLNAKRAFTVGLSIVLGMSVMLLPELVEEAPAWSTAIVESGLTIAAFSAVLLNAVFRIGVNQRAEIALSGGDAGEAAAAFLEHNGKSWGARKDAIMRAGISVGEALEALNEARIVEGPVTLAASFDEFNLVCRLRYRGSALQLGSEETVDVSTILDEDDEAALDAAMMRVSSVLVTRMADEVRASERAGRAELVLRFNH